MSTSHNTRSTGKQLRSGKIIRDIPVYIYTPTRKTKSKNLVYREQDPFKPINNLEKSFSESEINQATRRSLLCQYSDKVSAIEIDDKIEDLSEIEQSSIQRTPTSILLGREVSELDNLNKLISVFSHLEAPNVEIKKENEPIRFNSLITQQENNNEIRSTNSSEDQSIMPNSSDTAAMFDVSTFHKSIPEFDGNVENLNRFIACCDHFQSSLPDNSMKVTFLKALVRKFIGRAFDFYNKKDNWESWDELKLALKSYFSPTQSFEGYQIELCKCKQDKLSVREFGERIEKILVEINKISNRIEIAGENGGKFFKIQNEKLAVKSFLNGLNEPLKTILRSRKYNLIQDAIKDAIEIENEEILNKMQTINIGEPNITIESKQNPRENNKLTAISTPSEKKNVVCFKCNKQGHVSRNCFSNQNFFKSNNGKPNFYQNQYKYNQNNSSPYNNNSYNGHYNQHNGNYYQNIQRQGYFERNSNGQNNIKNFNQSQNRNNNNYNNNKQFNNDQFRQERNRYYHQNSANNNVYADRRNYQSQNRGDFNNINNRSYDNTMSNDQYNNFNRNQNSVQFRNEGNQNMQAVTPSKNISQQSTQMDSVALDFHMN